MDKNLIAAGITAVVLAAGVPIAINAIRGAQVKPELEETVTSESKNYKQNEVVFNENDYSISSGPGADLRLPNRVQFKDKDQKSTHNAYHRFVNEVVLPLQDDYANELKSRGRVSFTLYEIMQILGRNNVDKITEDEDGNEAGFAHLGEVTYTEVKEAIRKYQTNGKNAFQLRLQGDLVAEQRSNAPTTLDEAYAQWDKAVEDRWNASKERMDAKREGYDLAKNRFNQREAQRMQADVELQRQKQYWQNRNR